MDGWLFDKFIDVYELYITIYSCNFYVYFRIYFKLYEWRDRDNRRMPRVIYFYMYDVHI